MKTKDAKVSQPVARVESFEPCFMCNVVDHLPKDCSTYVEMRELREKCDILCFPNRFKQQWKPNPNLISWRNNQPSQSSSQWRPEAQPSWTYQAPSSSTSQQSFPLEDAFRSFIEVHSKFMEEQGKINKQLREEQLVSPFKCQD